MIFAHPEWLWMLIALPLWGLLEWRSARRADQAIRQLVGVREEPVLLEQRLPGQRRIGSLLRLLAAAILIFGAAGPEWGRELVRRSASGSDVVLSIDVSASMDARDVAPSRLEEARREAIAVLERLRGSKVGVVAFAGEAVRLCPLTLDRSAARLVLESLSSGTVSEPGTDLGKGLRAALRLLPPKSRSEQVVVMWTDGEDLERGARGAIEEAARTGVRVFTIGVGTAAGDVVPVLDEQGRVVDVKRDESGGPVRSRLDQGLLQSLARSTRGAYFAAARPGGELPRLLASLGPIVRGSDEESGRRERLVERPVPRFPWFAAAAALLLGYDRIRRRRRTPREAALPSRGAMHETPAVSGSNVGAAASRVAALALAIAALGPRDALAQSDWARADQAFRRGRWAEAESLYAKRAARRAPPEVSVDLATARAKAGRLEQAKEGLRRATSVEGRPGQVASYNLGTVHAGERAYDEALRSLRAALERDPRDQDARFNYEWALRRRQREERQSAPQKPEPQPSQPEPSSQGPSPPSQGPPSQPQPSANQPPAAPPPPPGGMDRQQAEQLLGSLQELERLEQQRLRQVRVMRERRGRDW